MSGFSLFTRVIAKVSDSGPVHTGGVAATSSVCGATAQDSVSSHCGSKCAMCAVGVVLGGVAIGYFIGYKMGQRRARVNTKIQLNNDKVVDTFNIEDIGEKKAYCRCWRSSKFPYCDGAHTKHNQETGDNVGPVVVKGKR